LFEGEKTSVFWAGLIILSFSFFILFLSLWSARMYVNWDFAFWDNLPVIIGAIYFILLGLVMMESGFKKDKLPTQS
jgi:putative Mn2+ efflux pump MntP